MRITETTGGSYYHHYQPTTGGTIAQSSYYQPTTGGTIAQSSYYQPTLISNKFLTGDYDSESLIINTKSVNLNEINDDIQLLEEKLKQLKAQKECLKINILRKRIKKNLLIHIPNKEIDFTFTTQEEKARCTLRDIISETEYRNYVIKGFLNVCSSSGKIYQIYKNQQWTKVFEKNMLLAEICIHTDRMCPPTDHVLNLKTMIEFNEEHIWKKGNVHWRNTLLIKHKKEQESFNENLLEFAKKLA